MPDWWYRELVLDLMSDVAVGDALVNRDRCNRLAGRLELLFHDEYPSWQAWAPEAATDGCSVNQVRRVKDDTFDAVGLIWLMWSNAGDSTFPFRATVRWTPQRTTIVGFIGQVEGRTGQVPRLPLDTLVVPGDPPELIVGRRQVPIVWMQVFEWSARGEP